MPSFLLNSILMRELHASQVWVRYLADPEALTRNPLHSSTTQVDYAGIIKEFQEELMQNVLIHFRAFSRRLI